MLFIHLTASWGPILHQAMAEEISYILYPNISDVHRTMFSLGARYGDGIRQKWISHRIKYLRELLTRYSPDKNEFWFFNGMYSHIIQDTYAHAGHRQSFIRAHGWIHTFSEFVADSYIFHKYHPKFQRIPDKFVKKLARIGITLTNRFRHFYSADYFLAPFPFHRLLPFVEYNVCKKSQHSNAYDRFEQHYTLMKESLMQWMPHNLDPTVDNQQIRIQSTHAVFELKCD